MRNQILNRKDVIEKFVRSSGNGGQNVNKVSTCVYLKHIPSGIEVKCSSERSQSANRKLAWELLELKLEELRHREYTSKVHAIEKIFRQTRPKPKSIKNHILEEKKRNSDKKNFRKKVDLRD
jgi:peptide chain release factor